jgi:hypothetical protein
MGSVKSDMLILFHVPSVEVYIHSLHQIVFRDILLQQMSVPCLCVTDVCEMQAMGIPMVIKFIKAVCASKKSWQARHTGIKSVQQIAILMGCAVLPHLTDLVHAIMNGLLDENQKVKTITALALAALAEAAAPYGIESFDAVLTQLWKDIKLLKGKV